MTELVLRPVRDADHDAWMPLWRGYQAFYKVDIAPQTSAETWRRFLDPAEPMHAVLAWQGERAVGLVHWILHRSCWSSSDFCYLNDLFAEPDVRGSGVGLTHESNEVAMRLYDRIAERSGFVQYRKALPPRA
jgi:GNAT superfamily N-acetyltransferase